ncbi:hypothetical protein [Pseudarthrobacter sp. L1SW]|uniref:hypothetical protein n=1 Tax=Pseudarthrobacter sp. L1SW TaxID=2851598 RepID=UPI001E2C3BAD|nr:hypothetical protein [Pseudarthrobacter sp. L1SW]UEL30097.1 hypothetical protein KTR40_08425 [Pseudarthrobacter sp. L1SW]
MAGVPQSVALGMASRNPGHLRGGRRQERRVAQEKFVAAVAVPNPELVGTFAVPGQRRPGAGELETDVMQSGRDTEAQTELGKAAPTVIE